MNTRKQQSGAANKVVQVAMVQSCQVTRKPCYVEHGGRWSSQRKTSQVMEENIKVRTSQSLSAMLHVVNDRSRRSHMTFNSCLRRSEGLTLFTPSTAPRPPVLDNTGLVPVERLPPLSPYKIPTEMTTFFDLLLTASSSVSLNRFPSTRLLKVNADTITVTSLKLTNTRDAQASLGVLRHTHPRR